MSSIFKKIASIALPIIGGLIAPGIGSVIGGAAGGLVGGGGLKDALTGAALGGISGYGGKILGSAGETINWTNAAPGYATGAGTIGGSGILGALGSVGGAISDGLGNITSAAGGAAKGGLSTLLNAGSNIYSGIQGQEAYKEMSKAQIDATNQAMNAAQPWLTSGVSANTQLAGMLGLNGDDKDDILERLRSTPGYQFRMDQGMDALNNSLAARGGLFSGNALRETQALGQGIADQTYNDYIAQLSRQSGSGQLAAAGMGDYMQDIGNINANRVAGENNSINSMIAGILGNNYSSDDYMKRLLAGAY